MVAILSHFHRSLQQPIAFLHFSLAHDSAENLARRMLGWRGTIQQGTQSFIYEQTMQRGAQKRSPLYPVCVIFLTIHFFMVTRTLTGIQMSRKKENCLHALIRENDDTMI